MILPTSCYIPQQQWEAFCKHTDIENRLVVAMGEGGIESFRLAGANCHIELGEQQGSAV